MHFCGIQKNTDCQDKGYKSFDVYGETKLANILFTFELARRLSGTGVTANCLAPGFFASEMTEQYAPGYLDTMMQRVPMARKGDPEELAAALVFLASDAGGYVTGQTLCVDGGITIA